MKEHEVTFRFNTPLEFLCQIIWKLTCKYQITGFYKIKYLNNFTSRKSKGIEADLLQQNILPSRNFGSM